MPYYLLFGKKPRLPIKLHLPVGEADNVSATVDQQLETRIETLLPLMTYQKKAKVNIQIAQTKQKEYFDSRFEAPAYTIGDEVLLKNSWRVNRMGDKLKSRWTGPFPIEEIHAKGTFKLGTGQW